MFKTIPYQKIALENPGSCKYRENEKTVFLVINGTMAVAIPKSQCMIDMSKLEKIETDIPSLFTVPEHYVELEATGYMRRLDTMTIEQFAFATTSYWLNSRKLKPFRKDYEYIASGDYVLMRNLISGDVDAVIVKVQSNN